MSTQRRLRPQAFSRSPRCSDLPRQALTKQNACFPIPAERTTGFSSWIMPMTEIRITHGIFHPVLMAPSLVTSRNPECAMHATVGSEELGPLAKEDCVDLLLNAAQIRGESRLRHTLAAEQVVEELSSHTLALLQAGAYIAQGYCSVDQYPRVYKHHCERLLKFSPQQAQSRYRSVYAAFEASAQVLKDSPADEAQDALVLVNMLSTLYPQNFPCRSL